MNGNQMFKSSGLDYTAADKLAEIEREIILRKKVYPGRVFNGHMSQQEAARHIDVMRAIARDYAPRALFGATPDRHPSEDAIARAIYEADPLIDGGECLDGFQVSPAGALSWAQVCESDGDAIYRQTARAVIALLTKGVP